MADRFPLIANSSAGQIQELPSGDNLNFSNNSIVGVGSVTATTFIGDGSGLTGVASTDNIRTNTNATFLQNVNVSGTVTATSYLGSGANLTSLPAAQLTGTLPAINGGNLTGISAGGMTLIHKAVVGSSSTVSQIIFQNLDYDSVYKIVGKKIEMSSNYYHEFKPYLNGSSSVSNSACNYNYQYYWGGYSNTSYGDWRIHDGGYYGTSYGNNSEFEFEFHTGTPTWVRGTGHYFDNYQSFCNMWGNLSPSFTPYSSYRISGMRLYNSQGYTYNAGSTFLLYKYNES